MMTPDGGILFQLDEVTKTYGALTALNNLTLSVPIGAIGLLGPNGSGKTTMIRTLLGLIPMDSGSGQILGMDIRRQQLDIRRQIGFAPEDECLFPRVVGVEFAAYAGELVGMSPKDAMQRSHEVLDYVGLGEARYRAVESYSTGMKQRLKLAAAIVHDPKLLILDEPTNGMDPAGRDEILELSRDLAHNKGISLIFSSHLLPDVEAVCDYVVVLGGGRLLTQGRIDELKQAHNRCFEIRVKSDPAPFARRLTAIGCSAEITDDLIRIRLPEDRSPQLLWQMAMEDGQQIRYLRPQRSTLEEVFLKAVEEPQVPIFDQGYQHWNGELSGHAWRWLAVTRHGVKVGLQNRWLRMALFAAWTPALALAAMLCLWGLLERHSAILLPIMKMLHDILGAPLVVDPKKFRLEVWTICYDFFLLTELRFGMILILLVGPNLISQDLRFNALPLYLSRPLRRIDYFLGKLGVIATFLAMVVVVPSIVAYILGLAFSLDITIVRDTFRLLVSSICYGLIITASAGALILALSSLSRNSRYIAMFWLGIWFVSSVLGGVLGDVARGERRQAHYREYVQQAQQNQQNPTANRRAMRPAPVMGNYQKEELVAAKTDWRPLVSYTANLQRIGQQLLGTNKAWESLGKLRRGNERDVFLLNYMGSQYPWYWSAGVLVGLFGISACILNFKIKSLDRLK